MKIILDNKIVEIKHAIELYVTVEQNAPYTDSIISTLLTNAKEFNEIIRTSDFFNLCSKYPEYENKFINFLFEQPTVFQHIVKDSSVVHNLSLYFPEHTVRLIKYLFQNPTEFKRLIQYDSDIELLKNIFRNCDLLNKKKSVELLQNIWDRIEGLDSMLKEIENLEKDASLTTKVSSSVCSLMPMPLEMKTSKNPSPTTEYNQERQRRKSF